MNDPYAAPAASLADPEPTRIEAHRDRWQRFMLVFACAFVAEIALAVLLSYILGSGPERTSWRRLLPLTLAAAGITALLLTWLPVRRTSVVVLVSVPAVVAVFFALGETLDRLGLI